MHRIKTVLSLLLAVLLCAAALPAAGAAAPLTAFSAAPYGDDAAAVSWYQANGTRYLFLPANADPAALRVHFTAAAPVYADGVRLNEGETTDVFAAGGAHTLTCGGVFYPLYVVSSANLPAVYITTQSGSLDYIHADKANKEKGAIRIYENGVLTLDTALKQIKGRGNSTWDQPKRPYNIKFDSKQDLFGMGKAKKWTLLASYLDPSLLHNRIALDLAAASGLFFTSEMRFVDLYVNGEYLGNYIICESVEVGAARVDIRDLDAANEAANPGVDLDALPQKSVRDGKPGSRKWIELPHTPEDLSGGYLLEYDFQIRYDEERSGFETDRGQNLTFKSPENASKAQVDYIADLYRRAEDALFSENGVGPDGKSVGNYFDLPSFAKMYLINELTVNFDAGCSSLYLFKQAGDDRFYASPAWDFDLAFGCDGSKCHMYANDPYRWFVNRMYTSDDNTAEQDVVDTVFTQLYRNSEAFRQEVKTQFAALYDLFAAGKTEEILQWGEALTPSAVMDALRWNTLNANRDPARAEAAFRAETEKTANFLNTRLAALQKGFAPNAASIWYDANGCVAHAVDANIYSLGQRAAVKDMDVLKSKNVVFTGWNTAGDGSGKSYAPGDMILLE